MSDTKMTGERASQGAPAPTGSEHRSELCERRSGATAEATRAITTEERNESGVER